MAMKTAPIQEPQASTTTSGSRKRRVKRKGSVGVMGSRKMAMWAPILRAA